MQEEQTPPATPSEVDANWQFNEDQTTSTPQELEDSGKFVDWTASEFIAHSKTVGWYFLLMFFAVGAAVLSYFVTGRDKLSAIVIVIAAVLFGIMAARKPRELPYRIDAKGIKIGDKSFGYANFKSFSVVQEESVESIWLMPLQRFMPGLSIYFEPTDKDKILEILDDYLPVEQRQLDFVDKLMHKIRF